MPNAELAGHHADAPVGDENTVIEANCADSAPEASTPGKPAA